MTFSHLSQHFYNGISVLYPNMMAELHISYTELGILTGAATIVSGFLQMTWSLLARYVNRGVLLGIGNLLASAGAFLMSGADRFLMLVGGNAVCGAGQAAQHPVGTSILAHKFPRAKVAEALSIHYGLGYIGNIISPIILASIAVSIGWRQALYALAAVPLTTGLVVFYTLRGDKSTLKSIEDREKGHLWKDFKAAIRVKSVILIIAAEAFAEGGSGMGVVTLYTPLFLKNFLRVGSLETSIIYAIAVLGGVMGTIFFGQLAKRYGNLIVAALITGLSSSLILLLRFYGLFSVLLVPHLFLIGATSFSGSSLLQAHLTSVSTPSQRDLILGLYFTLGFGTSSIWTTLTGSLIDVYGSFDPVWLLRTAVGTIALSLILLALRVSRVSSSNPTDK